MKRAAVLASLVLLAVACGADAGEQALSETASKLGEIRSGTLSLRFVATAAGEGASESDRVGFELEGPFALPRDGGLPIARMEFTKIAGSEQASATFLSTGEKAYAVVDGVTYELPAEDQERLRAAGRRLDAAGALRELELEAWVVDPKLVDGGRADGVQTDRITAALNVVAVVNDLVELADQVGAFPAERVEGESAAQLERAVEAARLEALTGKEDRLLRRLRVDVDFRAPSDLPAEVRGFLQAGLELELALTKVNKPVRVAAPADAQPFPGE